MFAYLLPIISYMSHIFACPNNIVVSHHKSLSNVFRRQEALALLIVVSQSYHCSCCRCHLFIFFSIIDMKYCHICHQGFLKWSNLSLGITRNVRLVIRDYYQDGQGLTKVVIRDCQYCFKTFNSLENIFYRKLNMSCQFCHRLRG